MSKLSSYPYKTAYILRGATALVRFFMAGSESAWDKPEVLSSSYFYAELTSFAPCCITNELAEELETQGGPRKKATTLKILRVITDSNYVAIT
jgi:hypothetical protein